jgi:hypothetical protein
MEEKIFCSRCKDPMSRIVYGYPTEALLEIAAEKGWIIGGCMPTPVSQYCKKCKVSWSEDLGFDKSAL